MLGLIMSGEDRSGQGQVRSVQVMSDSVKSAPIGVWLCQVMSVQVSSRQSQIGSIQVTTRPIRIMSGQFKSGHISPCKVRSGQAQVRSGHLKSRSSQVSTRSGQVRANQIKTG